VLPGSAGPVAVTSTDRKKPIPLPTSNQPTFLKTKMKLKLLLIPVILIMFASSVEAKKAEQKAVVADTSEKFELLVQAIRQEMAPGKRYEFLRDSDRVRVNQSLDRMAAMLAKSGSVDQLSSEEKTRLFNLQESVNGLLAKNADDRLVCSYVAPVGSHLPVKTCRTAREIERSRNEVRRQSEGIQNQGRIGDQSN
jgi:hypothetical protein